MEEKHRMVLEERSTLAFSGVKSVDSFDEEQIELDSTMGGIAIAGEGLKIAALDLLAGKVTIRGRIDSVAYVKSREEKSARRKGKNMMARLLK